MSLASIRFFSLLLFDPEDGGDIFNRNVGLFANYTDLQLKQQSPNSLP
jgi:hypothetical protein